MTKGNLLETQTGSTVLPASVLTYASAVSREIPAAHYPRVSKKPASPFTCASQATLCVSQHTDQPPPLPKTERTPHNAHQKEQELGFLKNELYLLPAKAQIRQNTRNKNCKIEMSLPFIQSTTCLGVHLLIGSITRAIIKPLYHSRHKEGGEIEGEKRRGVGSKWGGWEGNGRMSQSMAGAESGRISQCSPKMS